MPEITQHHTPEEAKAELLAAQKKKDDEVKEYLTIPPGGKPPYVPEPPPDPLLTETEVQRRTRLDYERRMKEENETRDKEALGAKGDTAQQAPHDRDYKSGKQAKEEETKAQTHTIGGRK
jgi:hypothetical protein